jgi:hypothetical protein
MKKVVYKERYIVYENGAVYSIKKKIFLKHSNSFSGYFTVSINSKNKCLHRVLAECFLPKIDGKNCVNHKDGNKKNNELSNLEWCNPQENSRHAWDNGLKYYHENTRKANSIAHSRLVINLQTGIYYQSAREAAKIIGMKDGTLRSMLNGRVRNKTSFVFA